jgi:hypothetical protein
MSLSSSTLGKLKKIVGSKGLLTSQVDLAAYSFDGTPTL